MKIRANGDVQEITPAMTIRQYLDGYLLQRGLDITLVSVELNFRIPPREQWDTIRLEDGDNLEIIRFIGGG